MEDFERLIQAGISRRTTEALAAHYGGRLLPLQQLALEQTGLLAGESVLVSAPTASGKTLLAEVAAIAQIQRSRLVFYLVPTRALAEQKAEEFRERLGGLGIRVACSTRDHREDDAAILRGEISLTVAVYEKAIALLCRRPSLMARIGLIAADEVQLIGDADRGGAIDLLLTRWKVSSPRPQLVALSAVLGNPEELADWLGVRLFRSELRPVPLHEGVLDLESGVFRYRDRSTGNINREILFDAAETRGDAEGELKLGALVELARRHGPLIYFASTRAEAARVAFEVAERRAFSGARGALAELALCEPELSRERLESLLPHGVGLHTAEMPARHRHLVEQAFHHGEIALLAATPTLEQKVNLSAATVVHSPLMMGCGGRGARPGLVPLSRGRLINQGGRAGRSGTAAGRSIIFARGEFEADQAWRTFFSPMPEPVESPLGQESLLAAIAENVWSGWAGNAQELRDFFRATLAARRRDFADLVGREVELGKKSALWRVEDEAIILTGLGEVVATTGIQPQTCALWSEMLRDCEPELGAMACLFLVSLATEWEEMPMRLDASERRHNRWPLGLRERLGRGTELSRRLDEYLMRQGGAPFACHLAARRALLLDDWLGGQTIAELELVHGMPSGQMAKMAGQAAWLMSAAAELAGVLALEEAAIKELEELAKRLAELDHALGRPMGADDGGAIRVPAAKPGEATSDGQPPAVIEEPRVVRLRFLKNDPGAVVFDGETVVLTVIQYQLLSLLARRAGSAVSYEEIHAVVWPDAFVERQMISFHRKRLEKSLGVEPGTLITTRSRWGLCLELSAEQVLFEGEEEVREAVG